MEKSDLPVLLFFYFKLPPVFLPFSPLPGLPAALPYDRLSLTVKI